jgi:16S rRNA (cytosine1402-N4)-methyltransferase
LAESASGTGFDNQSHELKHQSVLFAESLDLLNIRNGRTYIDATVGAGGHLRGIIDRLSGAASAEVAAHESNTCGPQGGDDTCHEKNRSGATTGETVAAESAVPDNSAFNNRDSTTSGVIGIDRDNRSLEAVRKILSPSQARLFHANYTDIKQVALEAGLRTISGGILADLGVSSMQLDNPERGFSFSKDGPLDMRMDESQYLTADEIVNKWDEKRLADTIYEYGEEKDSRYIARNIVNARPLKSTLELAEVVAKSARHRGKHNRHAHSIHPATRTFQALRIAVNDELGGLQRFLEDSIELLAPGARLVVITFHSLEDRMVKQIFRRYAQACECPPRQPLCTCNKKSELLVITKKPIVADEKEVLANMRSRSAKLRAGQKVG